MVKGPRGEFDGTGGDNGADNSGPIDPASLTGTGGPGGSDNGGGSDDDFDPAIHIGRDKRNADGSYRRKRGRKAGGTTAAKAGKIDIEGLASIIQSFHFLVASTTKAPELVLDEMEAKSLAKAGANVARHYPMEVAQKTLDWGALIYTMGAVYGPRGYLISTRVKKERQQSRQNDAGNVTVFPNVNGNQ